MVIGLDIDDTITRHPPFFAFLSRALLGAGHRVVVITFREDRVEAARALAEWGIAYTTLVTSSLQEHLEHGTDQWKGVVCEKYGVEVLFEDSPQVLRFVPPHILSLMAVDHERYDLEKICEEY